jgi:hypothetical protein
MNFSPSSSPCGSPPYTSHGNDECNFYTFFGDLLTSDENERTHGKATLKYVQILVK